MSDRPTIVLLIESKFPIGQLVVTAGAKEVLSHHDFETAMNSHASGEWGDLDKEDRKANDQALERGGRLLSAYESEHGGRFYIITEADRSYTTILLPEEY